MSINGQYTQELRKETGYSATWLPTNSVKPGDVGRMVNYEYQPYSTLESFGIPFTVVPGATQAEFNYASAGSVSVKVHGEGGGPIPNVPIAGAKLGITVAFKRAEAVLFQATGCVSNQIQDRRALEQEILKRYATKEWGDDLVVILEVVQAAGTTVLISNSSDANMELTGNANVGTAGINLANVDADLQVQSQSNIATQILASKGLTPLFRAAGIHKPIFGHPTLTLRGDEDNEIVFAAVDYADYSGNPK